MTPKFKVTVGITNIITCIALLLAGVLPTSGEIIVPPDLLRLEGQRLGRTIEGQQEALDLLLEAIGLLQARVNGLQDLKGGVPTSRPRPDCQGEVRR